MTVEITILKWVIVLSLFAFKVEEPQETESSVLYKMISNDETGELIKVPYLKPLEG